MFSRLIDFFVPPQFRHDGDVLLRVRILVIVLLALTLQEALVFLVLLAYFDGVAIFYGGCLTMLSAASSLFFLNSLRTRGSYVMSSTGVVLTTLVLICSGIWLSGGLFESPATQLLALPALMAFFFSGVGLGAAMTAATLFAAAVIFGLQYAHIAVPRVVEISTQLRAERILLSAVNFLLLTGLVLAYEYTARELRRERRREQEKIQHLAKTDPLTGLANRRNFDAALRERVQRYDSATNSNVFVLGCLDLDGFKPINDRYGHRVGDEVLRIVSDRLRASLRSEEFVGRYGGDEFMLILEIQSQAFDPEQMAYRLLTAIEQPISTSQGILELSGSIGFAVFPQHGDDIEALIQAADAAMYYAKRQQTKWCSYRDELKQAM